MFDIEYKGGNSIVVTTKKAKLVVDPNLSIVGLKNVSVKDAVELATEARFLVSDDTARLVLEGPGEYEVADFSIRGIAAQRHLDTEATEKLSTIYRIEVGEVRIALIGNIFGKLSEDQLEEIGVVDVVIIPVGGGGYTLDATSAASLARQINANVIIPVHYADSSVKYEVPQDNLDVFLKELGAPVETMSKLKVKAASSLPQVLTAIELTRS